MKRVIRDAPPILLLPLFGFEGLSGLLNSCARICARMEMFLLSIRGIAAISSEPVFSMRKGAWL